MNLNRLSKVLFLSLTLILVTVGFTQAQESGYTISRWSFISGSSHSGGGYQLYAIAGQPEAGAPSSGEGYTLTGGLRPDRALPHAPRQSKVFVPMVVRDP